MLGILVLGFARPALLRNVLESLHRQGASGITHVWIDGTANRMELSCGNDVCADAARNYPVREVRAHFGHYGIEGLMIHALKAMSAIYERILVLEDDCFPTRHAVTMFSQALEAIEQDDGVYSVYGHPFGVEPASKRFSRFQGWGWATTRRKLRPVLEELERRFMMDEASYATLVRDALTSELIERLDKTPPRNVIDVMRKHFSWDSGTALITAALRLDHMATPERVIYNCGLTPGQGHFNDVPLMRGSPFNMIAPDEVWDVY